MANHSPLGVGMGSGFFPSPYKDLYATRPIPDVPSHRFRSNFNTDKPSLSSGSFILPYLKASGAGGGGQFISRLRCQLPGLRRKSSLHPSGIRETASCTRVTPSVEQMINVKETRRTEQWKGSNKNLYHDKCTFFFSYDVTDSLV